MQYLFFIYSQDSVAQHALIVVSLTICTTNFLSTPLTKDSSSGLGIFAAVNLTNITEWTFIEDSYSWTFLQITAMF